MNDTHGSLVNPTDTEILERRVRNDPTNADDLLALGDLYRASHFPERAINVYLLAADRYGERDAWQRVAAIYKMILLLDPEARTVRSRLADVYCLIGLKKDAQDELLLLAKAYETSGDLTMRDRTLQRLQVLFGANLDPHCAFCGGSDKDVAHLVGRHEIRPNGPEVFICDACLSRCASVLERREGR